MPPLSVDFIVVGYHNAGRDLAALTRGLLEASLACAARSRVQLVLNDDTSFESHEGVDVIQGHGNVGFAAGVRLGVLRSSADHVVIVNPDCLPGGPALREFLAHLGPGCGVLVPKLLDSAGHFDYMAYENWTFSVGRKYAEVLCRWNLGRSNGGKLPRYAKVPGAFVGLERSLAIALDCPFDSAFFLYAEDRDMTDRLRHARIPVTYLPKVSITHLGGRSGANVPLLVKACEADGALRVAFRRYGRVGAMACALDVAATRRLKRLLRGETFTDHAVSAAILRWRHARLADPGPLSENELSAALALLAQRAGDSHATPE